MLFEKETCILETDRYHKWERGNENYKTYTHLNPYANHLERMSEDVFQYKIGQDVYHNERNGISEANGLCFSVSNGVPKPLL